MAVLSSTSTLRPEISNCPATAPSKPSLTRASTQQAHAPGGGVTISRRPRTVSSPDPLGTYPHALPLFRGSKQATAMRRYDNEHMPFFFLRSKDPYVTPLSGLLNPRQRPPEAQVVRDGSREARADVGAAAFNHLNDALQLNGAKGMLVMHHADGHFARDISLGLWRDFAQDARACAIVSCLLRLSPSRSWYLSDSELLSHTLAAACLMAGCLVRRDISAAESFVSRIPLEDRGRAQAVTLAYIEQHDLWPLRDYMQPEAGLLGETQLPPAWHQPRRWPGLVKATALWLLDVGLLDQDE